MGFIWIHVNLFLFKYYLIDHPEPIGGDQAAQVSVRAAVDKLLAGSPEQTRALVTTEFESKFGVSLDKATLATLRARDERPPTGPAAVVAGRRSGHHGRHR